MKYIYNPESRRLMADHKAIISYRRFSAGINSRRRAKHPAAGQVLKNSRIQYQTGLDTITNAPGWVKRAQLDRWGK
jgi:hypothetical protein